MKETDRIPTDLSRYVIGHGPENSPLMVIGDYPTKEEVFRGKAWEGSSANLLQRLLRANDYDLNKCFKTVFIKSLSAEVSAGLGIKTKKQRMKAIDGMFVGGTYINPFKKPLIEEIKAIKPRVILAAGELALRFLTNCRDVQKFRGSVLLPSDEIKLALPEDRRLVIIPILSPRDLFADQRAIYYTKYDISKAIHYLSNPYFPPFSKYMIWVCKSASEFRAFTARGMKDAKFLTTDVETFLGYITCASFCLDGKEAVCVPLLDDEVNIDEKVQLYYLIDKLLRCGLPIINQNLKFDWTIYEKWLFRLPTAWDDTMLRSHTLYPEMPRDLGFLTSIYTDIPYYKDENQGFNPNKGNKLVFYLYNAKDSLSVHIIATEQEQELKENVIWPGFTQWDFHQNFVVPLFHIYKKIDERGLLVDEAQRQVLRTKYSTILEERQKLINEIAGEKINVDSTGRGGQAGKFIYEILGFPARYHLSEKGEKVYDTDEETIEDLALNIADSNAVKMLLYNFLACRKCKRFLKFLSLKLFDDHTLKTVYKLQGSVTGRTSTSECLERYIDENTGKEKNYGTAFQKMPKHPEELPDGTLLGEDLRTIFVPHPGKCFVEVDSKGAEARVVAVLAEDYEMLDKMERIHYITAGWLFNKPETEIKKGSHEYDIGKRGRHAGHYDMEAYRLSIMAHVPQKQAELILHRFHERSPKIRGVFHAAIQDLLDPRRGGKQRLITPFGRIRDFFDRITDKTIKEGYAHIPQSTISDNTKRALLQVNEKISRFASILVEWHDSLVGEVEISHLEEYCILLNQEMSAPIDFRKGSIPRDIQLSVPTDITVGFDNWCEMEDIKL